MIEHDPFSMSEEDGSTDSVQAEKVESDSVDVASKKKATSPVPEEENACIDLGSSLIINEVETYRNTLLDALQAGSDLVLDGGEIQQIDGAGLQLLAAFAKEAEKTGVPCRWHAVSQVLCEAANRLDLSATLQLDEA